MRLSISITNHSWRDHPLRDGLLQVARAADEGGLHTVWVPDHLAQVDPTVTADADDMLEAYGVLCYLTGHTDRVRLGTLVTNVVLRPPALLATAVATLDALCLTAYCGDNVLPAEPGSLVFLPRGIPHHFTVDTAVVTLLLIVTLAASRTTSAPSPRHPTSRPAESCVTGTASTGREQTPAQQSEARATSCEERAS